jgi:hypothetical protein
VTRIGDRARPLDLAQLASRPVTPRP